MPASVTVVLPGLSNGCLAGYLASSIAVSLFAGCGHTAAWDLKPGAIPAAIRTLRPVESGKAVAVVVDGKQTTVRPENAPRLKIHIDRSKACADQELVLGGWTQGKCEDTELVAPLGEVRISGGKLGLSVSEHRYVEIPASRVAGAKILLDRWDPELWRPRWGLGGTIGGPGLGGFQAQAFLTEWMVLDGAVMPLFRDFWWGFMGFRLRPMQFHGARPFVGAFANWTGSASSDDTKGELNDNFGARIGLDIPADRYWLVGIEFNLLHRNRGKFLGEIDATWIPWGGTAVTYLW